jgi:hypothetical protein
MQEKSALNQLGFRTERTDQLTRLTPAQRMHARDGPPRFDPPLSFLLLGLRRRARYAVGREFFSLFC